MWTRKKGQSVSGEYVVLVALAAVAITTMTIYVRRTLQGRMRDATLLAADRAGAVMGQPVLIEYEPYYTNTVADTDMMSTQTQRVAGDNAMAHSSNTERRTRSQSEQLPFAAY